MTTTKNAQAPRKLKRRITDPMIPSPLPYVNRNVEGGITDYELFDYARKNRLPLLIEGPTGCGKTMAIQSYAADRQLRFASVSCNAGMDPSQLFGRVIPDGEGGFVWQDGVVTDMVRRGGILLLNEVNFMPERISTALFSLFDRRRTITLLDHKGEVIEAHENLMLVSDMNPGYLGTRQLNAAFRNRQALQSVWDYDPEVEKRLVKSDTLLTVAQGIRKSDDFDTPVSTNMLMEFCSMADEFGFEFAQTIFTNHFSADERLAVRQTLATYESEIIAEIGTKQAKPKPAATDAGFTFYTKG